MEEAPELEAKSATAVTLEGPPSLTWCGSDRPEAERKLFRTLLKAKLPYEEKKRLVDEVAEPQEWMYSCLLKTLGDTGGAHLLEGKALWRQLKKEKKVTLSTQAYSAMVYLWARNRDMEGATYAIMEMEADNVPISPLTFQALMSQRKPHHRFVKQVFDLMAKFGLSPSANCFNILIEALGRDGEFEEVERAFNALQATAGGANAHTYLSVLKARCQEGKGELAREVLAQMAEYVAGLPNDDGAAPLASTQENARRVLRRATHALFLHYEVLAEGRLAQTLLDDCKEKLGLGTSTRAHNSVIRAFFNAGNGKAAVRAFQALRDSKHRLDEASFPAALDAHLLLGDVDAAQELMSEVVDQGFKYTKDDFAPTASMPILNHYRDLQEQRSQAKE